MSDGARCADYEERMMAKAAKEVACAVCKVEMLTRVPVTMYDRRTGQERVVNFRKRQKSGLSLRLSTWLLHREKDNTYARESHEYELCPTCARVVMDTLLELGIGEAVVPGVARAQSREERRAELKQQFEAQQRGFDGTFNKGA